jgi:hypothetical protein
LVTYNVGLCRMANGSLDAPYEGASIEAANIAEALQKASRITPGFRSFLMAAAFAALRRGIFYLRKSSGSLAMACVNSSHGSRDQRPLARDVCDHW